MRTAGGWLACAALALTAAIGMNGEVHAQAPIGPGIAFRVASNHSGQCWDVPGEQFADGVALAQYPCHQGNNQLWTFETVSTDGGEATLIKSADPNLCAGRSDAGQIILQPCDANAAGQQWILDRSDPSGFWVQHIRSQLNGECIDVAGASLDREAALLTYACHDGRNQQWLLLGLP